MIWSSDSVKVKSIEALFAPLCSSPSFWRGGGGIFERSARGILLEGERGLRRNGRVSSFRAYVLRQNDIIDDTNTKLLSRFCRAVVVVCRSKSPSESSSFLLSSLSTSSASQNPRLGTLRQLTQIQPVQSDALATIPSLAFAFIASQLNSVSTSSFLVSRIRTAARRKSSSGCRMSSCSHALPPRIGLGCPLHVGTLHVIDESSCTSAIGVASCTIGPKRRDTPPSSLT